ncbi:MAG: AAA family ATPase [Puniceicoccales bacterium]|nr:AAA family ATPase [Puniceicoccales bacterium]
MKSKKKPQLTFAKKATIHFFANFLKNHDECIMDDDVFEVVDEFLLPSETEALFRRVFHAGQIKLLQNAHHERLKIDFKNDFPSDVFAKAWNYRFARPRIVALVRTLAQLHVDGFNAGTLPTITGSRGTNSDVSAPEPTTGSAAESADRSASGAATGATSPNAPSDTASATGNTSEEPADDDLKQRFDELKTTLHLSDFECDVLLVVFLLERHHLPYPDSLTAGGSTTSLIQFFAKCLDCPETKVRKALSPNERLRRFGCFTNRPDRIVLTNEMDFFLDGLDDKPLTSRYFHKYEDETLPWNFFGEIAREHGDLLKKIISKRKNGQGVNILLYGAPGTGKTSFARALAKELNLDAICITETISGGTIPPEMSAGASFRFGAMHLAAERADPEHSLLIVDEADALLGDPPSDIAFLFGSAPRLSD